MLFTSYFTFFVATIYILLLLLSLSFILLAGIEELDEFNESPHVVHSDTVALTTAECINADDEDVIFTRATLKNGIAYS